jgi:hypothetical protein
MVRCMMLEYSRVLLAMYGVATIVACDSAEVPTAPREPQRQDAAPRGRTEARTAAGLPTTASQIGVELRAVRTLGDEVQVEVAFDRPIPPTGHTRPELQVGDEVVRRSRAGAGGRLDRLVFTMPAAQFERMPKDRAMVVRAGVLTNESVESKPRLSDVAVIGGNG